MTQENNKGCFHFVGRIISISLKVFVYFILGIVGISLLAALFGMGVAGTSLLPLKGFILEDGLQTFAVFGAIIFFIWVPIIGIVTAVIRKIAGYKKSNNWVRTSFISLWVLGWVCLFYFFSSLGNSFSKHNIPVEEMAQLKNAKVDFLEITATPKMKYYDDKWFEITPFSNYNDADTLFVRNMRVRIVQSKTDSFQITYVKLSNGKTVKEANANANQINFSVTQMDSLLYLDKGIAISKQNKFRNQHIIMTVAVPIGKRIKISNHNFRQFNLRVNRSSIQTETLNGFSDGWYDEWNEPWDNESYSFDKGVEYKMTAAGLEKVKRDYDAMENGATDSQDEMDQKLKKLKQERLEMEQNIEKNKPSKPAEAPMDKKIKTGNVTDINNATKMASKLTDMHWVLDRFSY